MAWLRPILLLAGAVFIALLIWWERRRPRQAQDQDQQSGRQARSTPTLEPLAGQDGDTSMAGRSAQVPRERNAEQPVRDRDTRRAPPVINWSVEAPVPGASRPDETARPAATATDSALPPNLPEPPPLIVAWPPENQRSIVTLRVVPAGPDRLAGRALRLGLTACGFRHGQFDIFHLPAEDGRVVLSAASLVRPGTLEPAAMDQQRYSGVNLFAVLPGPLSLEQTLQRLGQVACELAERVGGTAQDETGATFTAADSGSWRRRRLAMVGAATAGAGESAD